MHLDATLTIEGTARPLPADASLALYRAVQEALTNVARYAPGARTSIVLRYGSDHTSLIVEDRLSTAVSPQSTDGAPSGPGGGLPDVGGGLPGVGGGRGLAGMRERLERAGGSMRAGPTDQGWLVELDVPA
jgi:signal transduction histidine kinase